MRPVSDVVYSTYVSLLKNDFHVPVKQRTSEQRNAVVNFYRRKDQLSLVQIDGKEKVFFGGREPLQKSDLKKEVIRTFKQSKGLGSRKISCKLRDKYASVSERKIAKVLQTSDTHYKINARFTNKPVLRTIKARFIFDRVQIDLLNMRKNKVMYEGKEYRYVLSAIDVFSWYAFLYPLTNRKSSTVCKALKSIFDEHGYPHIAQMEMVRNLKGVYGDCS